MLNDEQSQEAKGITEEGTLEKLYKRALETSTLGVQVRKAVENEIGEAPGPELLEVALHRDHRFFKLKTAIWTAAKAGSVSLLTTTANSLTPRAEDSIHPTSKPSIPAGNNQTVLL